MQLETLKPILDAFPLFSTMEEKEKFLVLVTALNLRIVSLTKAAEIMDMSQDRFLGLLDAMNIDYSLLDENDIDIERIWENESSI